MARASIREIQAAVRSKEVSAAGIVDSCLAKIVVTAMLISKPTAAQSSAKAAKAAAGNGTDGCFWQTFFQESSEFLFVWRGLRWSGECRGDQERRKQAC